LQQAADEICVLVQVESVNALNGIAEIAAVDGVFFGPADLSASMGLLGNPADSRVQKAIADGIDCVRRQGKAAGILASAPALAHKYLELGALFVAVGVDTTLLSRTATELAAAFKSQSQPAANTPTSGVY
jgi:4-hydroxy-2-oxoheptanedioate aldolase